MALTLMQEAVKVLAHPSHAKPALPLPPINMDDVLKQLPYVMFNMWLKRLQTKCVKCSEMQLVFQEPLRRDDEHTCHWGKSEIPLTEATKKEITKELFTSRKVYGMLLLLKPYGTATTFGNLAEIDIKAFLAANEGHLWEETKKTAMTELKITAIKEDLF